MSLKSKPYFEDIICAQASPSGVGAISLIRVSGKGSKNLFASLAKRDEASIETHKAYYHKVSNNSKFIDEVLITYFEDGKSFTGEESFEVTCHGSPLIVSDFLNVLMEHGARLAEPGEFSYRAYLNGCIDLTKAEGIHHSIHAKTDLAKELSLNLLEGGFKKDLLEIKDLVVWAASRVEASIDFSDQDIDLNHDKEVFDKITNARKILKSLLESYSLGVVQSKGVSIALCGPPNAGKSTLFNALLGDSRSIVSEEKGTTRDYITEAVSLKSQPVQLIDTAGLRETENRIESAGIRRSIELASKSQLILFLVSKETIEENGVYFEQLKTLDTPMLVVETKQDLGEWSSGYESCDTVKLSSQNKEDIEGLKDLVFSKLEHYFEINKNLFVERHRLLIEDSWKALDQITDFNEISGVEDVISSLLYSSIDSLDEILYIEDPEAVRDQIFKDFCLGK